MATIGMDKLFYSMITENAAGEETYGTPKVLAKAMQADLSVELAEATLYADDAAAEVVKAFKSGKISLGVDDLANGVAEDLTGARLDCNGVLISSAEDTNTAVAIGFRAKKANGKYRYFWLYRVIFAIPSTSLQTKGDSITFSTPTIEGTVLRRNRADNAGGHPWKAEVTEGAAGVNPSVISGWYSDVYEPSYDAPVLSTLTIGALVLSPSFDPEVTEYAATTTNATNTVTATAASGLTVEITVNDDEIDSGDSVTWDTGVNIVAVTVSNGSASKTYTITVTKS